MAYNAQDGSLSAKPYAPSQGVPTDARSYYFDSALYKWRPYQSTAEVLTFLDTPAKRSGHFPIFVHSGTLNTSNGTFTGGSVTEYYFKDGISDANLVLKTAPGSSTSLDGLSDVVVSSPVLHQVLQYNGTQWVNQQLAGYANNYPTSVSFNATTNVLTIARNGLSDLTVDLSDLQDSAADGNNYPTALSFNSSTNVLTISRSGLADLTVDLSDLQDSGSTYTPTITTASTSQTLSTDYETWVFTGSSAATFTLPATGTRYVIKSRGTGTLTVAGTIYTNSAKTSITILNGDSYTFQWDGSYWNVL